jgi:hypothetical protein
MAKMNKFEGSKKDMAQDAKLAKKYKMSPKEYEKSSVDAKHDKQKSMAGLKYGGSMYASGGAVAKGDTVAKQVAKDYRQLDKQVKKRAKQDYKDKKKADKDPEVMRERPFNEFGTAKAAATAPTAATKTATTAPTAAKGPEGMRERMRGLMSPEMRARIEAAKARGAMPTRPEMPTPPARPAMPMRPAAMPVRPAVMPVRSGMAKGGMAKGGMAKDCMAKGGMAKGKMVKMASGGSFRSSANGIASKGKTKGRMC